MSGTGQTVSDLAGLALAGTVIALTWPAACKYFKQWTWRQMLQFFVAVLLCIAFALMWIPVVELLTVRNTAGKAPPGAAGGAVLVMLGWTALGVIWLTRYCVRVLPAPANRPQPPKWLLHFGAVDALCLVVVAAGFGVMLFVRYG